MTAFEPEHNRNKCFVLVDIVGEAIFDAKRILEQVLETEEDVALDRVVLVDCQTTR